MLPARLRLAPLLAVLFAAAGCASADPQGELPPEYDLANVQQASIDCTQWTDTGYVDGQPFTINLVTVDGKPVEVATANAYVVMQQAAANDGVSIKVVSGFRTYAEQEYLYNCYINCNCNNCNLAAKPGYSNHQSGHALDLNTSSAGVLSWLNNHGAAYGFERTVASEDWHWEWWGGGPGGGPCTDNTPPTPCTVTSTGKTGECMDTGKCAALGNHESTAGLCPGPSNIQCCTATDPEPCTVTTTGKSGECLDVTECAAKGGHESTPGYCPGPDNIQCCTVADQPEAGVEDAAQPPGPDAEVQDAAPAKDSGVAQDAGKPTDAGAQEAGTVSDAGSTDSGPAWEETADSSGCSLAPSRSGRDGIVAALFGLLFAAMGTRIVRR